MKKSNVAKIVLCLMLLVATVLTVASCGNKDSLSGEYYYDYNRDGRSGGDIKLEFSNKTVTVTKYTSRKVTTGNYPYNSYYTTVEESDPIKGTYEIEENYISFDFDGVDYDELPSLLSGSERLYFEQNGDVIRIGYTSFEKAKGEFEEVKSEFEEGFDEVFGDVFESSFFQWIIGMIPLIIVFVVAINIISAIKKKKNKDKNPSATEEIGDKDEVIKENGWYRFQEDVQPVIERTEEQQRIVDEYFIVRNYKTTNCISAHKKKYKIFNIISKIILPIGLLSAVLIFLKEGFDLESAFQNGWFIFGIIITIGGFIFKAVANKYQKLFEASIKHTVAPKKLMTDEEYEALVQERIDSMGIASIGMERIGIDPDQVKEIKPIILRDKVVTDESLRVYNSETKVLHSSTQYVTMLYFTDEELFVYKLQFDMCCDRQEEWASEFFYQDICDVSSYVNKNIVKYEDYKYEYSTVCFEIIASNSKIGFEIDGDNENIASIQAMKQKIRDRKVR